MHLNARAKPRTAKRTAKFADRNFEAIGKTGAHVPNSTDCKLCRDSDVINSHVLKVSNSPVKRFNLRHSGRSQPAHPTPKNNDMKANLGRG